MAVSREPYPLRAEPNQAEPLPSGPGTVHLKGGARLRGHVRLYPTWVVLTLDYPDEDGAERRAFRARRVTSVDFDFEMDGE